MRKFRRNYIVVPLITVIIILTAVSGGPAFAGKDHAFAANKSLISLPDTIPGAATDTLITPDSISGVIDTTLQVTADTFSLKLSKDTLDAPIEYEAEDSIVGLVDQKIIILYGKARTKYGDVELSAPVIELDQEKNIVRAHSGLDSTGAVDEYVKMKQGENEFQSSGTMEYNFKTMQGITRGTITQQGEMFVHAEIAKKVDERTMYAKGTFFTTCNLDEPHFGFRGQRAKIVNKKLAVTGSIRPEFDSVPVPVYLPFGFFPLYQGRRGGVLSPSFETNDQMGLGLSGMGYYIAVSDYWDVELRGNIYSYGSWSVQAMPKYVKKYKYSGGASIGFQQTRRNFKGDPDFFKTNSYQFNWSHGIDPRSRPGTSFNANVNASSTKYNENVPNSNLINYQNALGSSITYSKTWQDKPYNLSVSANHNQVNVSRITTISFPNVTFNMNTLYPLERKEAVGSKKWYEQLGIGYQGSFRNQVAFYDTLNYRQHRGKSIWEFLLDTTSWGASHSVPITLSLPPILGGALMVAPSVSYSMDMIDRRYRFEYARIDGRDTNIAHREGGFGIRQRASFGVGLNTALYGKFRMKGGTQLRHVARPTLGFNYTPDLSAKEWRTVQVDSLGTKVLYNQLDPSPYLNRGMSQFVSRKFGGVTFSFDNNLEMKRRVKKKKKDSEEDGTDSTSLALNPADSTNLAGEPAAPTIKTEDTEFKKIRLIEGFGFNTSYNMFADSMQLSPMMIYFRTNLFEKININVGGTLVPYLLNNSGMATRHYAWQGDRFSIGKLTNANISMSTSFQSKPKDPEKEKKRQEALNQNLNDPMLQADQQRLLEYMRQNPAEFVDFNTPWSINLSFSLNYNRGGLDKERGKWQNMITSSTNFGGSFNLSPKWNFSVNGFYDLSTKTIQTFSMAISRDLHCWQMAINVAPVGRFRYFNFTISPKAGVLQDLKVNRNRSFFSGANY